MVVGVKAREMRLFSQLAQDANLKVGKFELDNMLSEKRSLMLSSNGTFYQTYHFVPVGDGTDFGLGDNQIGAEWLGHSPNSYTRLSVAVLGGVDGVPGLPSGKSYDGAVTLSQAFDAGRLGQPGVARRVALTMQEALGLPASAIESDGRGDARGDPAPGR